MTEASFQNGVGGYSGTVDTYVSANKANTSYGSATQLMADTETPNGSGKPAQALVRFDNIFGTGTGQIPVGASIISATLVLDTTDTGGGATLHRMLAAFAGSSTWNSLGSGVQLGTEAVSGADAVVGATALGQTSINVTASLQAWAAGAANLGWLINPTSTDGWGFTSAEGAGFKPRLVVNYTVGNTPPVAGNDSVRTNEDTAVLVSVLANDFDADSDTLVITASTGPAHGTITINPDKTISYTPVANYNGTDSFTYTVSDGRGGQSTATVSITVDPVNDNPVAANDQVTAAYNAPSVINVLANDSDVDGDALSFVNISSAAHGSVIVNSDKTLTYTPTTGFYGSDSFTYTISDGHGGQATATVNVSIPAPAGESNSYIATTFGASTSANFEHSNASKSFYHDGHWFAVLPDGNKWNVERFDGPIPQVGAKGGWTVAGDGLSTLVKRTDIAFDSVHDKLYVLQSSSSSAKPLLYKMGYNPATQSWSKEATIELAGGTNSPLSGPQWSNNDEMALSLDPNGNPIVTAIGPSEASGSPTGLFMAFANGTNLSSWSQTVLDPNTTQTGGSNGDSKADLVNFKLNGQDMVGIVYSADNGSNDSWKIAYHAVSATAAYGSGWSFDTLNTTVSIDNHISVVSDGACLYVAMKDATNAVYLQKGVPGAWQQPVKVLNGGVDVGPSRPTLVLDDTHNDLYIFYQEHTTGNTGSIYMKEVDTDNLSFNPASLGTKILTTGSSLLDLVDPQGPAQHVGDETGGSFFLFARGQDENNIWYNDIVLS